MNYPPNPDYPAGAVPGAVQPVGPYPEPPSHDYPVPADGPQPGQWQPPNPSYAAQPAHGKSVGVVAFIAGMVTLIGSAATGVTVAVVLSPEVLRPIADAWIMAPLINLTLGLSIALILLPAWFLFSLWPIIQGIAAMVQKSGVNYGVTALVLGLIGPWIGVTIPLLYLAPYISST
ncbi:MAG: hypothetical protein ACK5H2_14290 [Beutenbergiaceae bacterium]